MNLPTWPILFRQAILLYPLVWLKITICKSCASSGHGFHSELLNNPRISISLFPIRITLESHYNPIKFLQIPLSYHRHVPFGYRPLIFKFSVRRSRVEVDPLPLVQSAGEAQYHSVVAGMIQWKTRQLKMIDTLMVNWFVVTVTWILWFPIYWE
jgi:hypothetical protein